MNKQYCDCRLTYEGWIAKAKQVNKLLKETYDSIYQVELMTEPVLEENAMIATPHEYIVIDLTEANLEHNSMIATPHEYIVIDIDAQYEAEYEDYIDYKSYNASYGVY